MLPAKFPLQIEDVSLCCICCCTDDIHAEIAYNTSDFDKALILIADGGGDCVHGQYEAEGLFIGIAKHHIAEIRYNQAEISL